MNWTAKYSSSWHWVGYNKVFMTFANMWSTKMILVGTIGKKSIDVFHVIPLQTSMLLLSLFDQSPTHPNSSLDFNNLSRYPFQFTDPSTSHHKCININIRKAKNQSSPPQLLAWTTIIIIIALWPKYVLKIFCSALMWTMHLAIIIIIIIIITRPRPAFGRLGLGRSLGG